MAEHRPIAALAASAWALLFAAVHLYWALGGRAALPADIVMAERPLLLAIDILAIPLCLCAAALAHRLRRPAVRGAVLAAWVVAAACLGHALPTMSRLLAALATGQPPTGHPLSLYLYEPYWLLGGLLFAAAAHRSGFARRA